MQICRSLSIFCARLFCCIPTQTRQVPASPSSQQMLALVVTHLQIRSESTKMRDFYAASSKTSVSQYDCALSFSDGTSCEVQLTAHRISQLIAKYHLSPENSTLQNDAEDTFFTESLVAESVHETESPEIWLRSIHRTSPTSSSMPSLERMDASQEGIKLEPIRED